MSSALQVVHMCRVGVAGWFSLPLVALVYTPGFHVCLARYRSGDNGVFSLLLLLIAYCLLWSTAGIFFLSKMHEWLIATFFDEKFIRGCILLCCFAVFRWAGGWGLSTSGVAVVVGGVHPARGFFVLNVGGFFFVLWV